MSNDETQGISPDEISKYLDVAAAETLPEEHRSGFVAVLGQPNVGKSTFINAVVGQKVAITSPKPQTTRRRIRGIITQEDAQVIFLDTPGIHEPFHKLGEFMVETAYRTIPDADVLIFMVDGAYSPNDNDRMIAERLKGCEQPIILIINKADKISIDEAQERADEYTALGDFNEWFLTSVQEGRDLPRIVETIIAFLPEGPRFYPSGQVTDQTERDLAGELVREAALYFLREEVPHSVEVQVDEFKERENGMVYISANVFVERGSQKSIVIGKGGSMLKKIGRRARTSIERLLGQKVYLDLWVKVRPKWRRNAGVLRHWGYNPSE